MPAAADLFCATIVHRENLTPRMVRLVLGGEGLRGWTSNGFSDAYFVVWLPRPGAPYAAPFDVERVRAEHPEEWWPVHRHYSVRRWDAASVELTVDFVVHGDEGVAGPWARKAQVGDQVMVGRPGGAYIPDAGADWHLMVGDESALPAIGAALEQLPAGAGAVLIALCDGPELEVHLGSLATVEAHWLHRCGEPTDARLLIDAVRALPWRAGRVHAFVHGEAGEVREVRRHLLGERGMPRADLSVSGYWRRTMTDEAWRRVKREWNADVERDLPADTGLAARPG